MQRKKWPFLFSLVVGLLLTLFFVLPAVANVDTGWDWPDGTDGKPKRTLTYCVEGDDADFESDVETAAKAWSDAGLGWTLNKVDNCDDADIVVKQADLGGTKGGKITLGSCVVNGSEGAWKGTAQGGTIRINSNSDANWGTPPAGRNRVRTIMHEFGHAMRLDHTFGAGDIMKQSTSTITGIAISDEDRREARTAANYTVGGTKVVGYVDPNTTSEVVIRPLPGAAASMNLSDTVFVGLTSFYPGMTIEALPGAERGAITATVSGVNTATVGHHVGVTITLEYLDSTEKTFHAEIPVTAEPLDSGSVPHANFVITPEMALANELIHLDAEPSSHEMSPEEAQMTYRWRIAAQEGDQVWYTYHDYSALFLPAGEYTVTLILEDRWGQVDEMSQPLIVHPHLVYVPLVLR